MRVLLTGAGGMLGSHIVAEWARHRPGDDLVPVRRTDVDLRDAASTTRMFAASRADSVLHAAAVVAGISEKIARPEDFLVENQRIDDSVISAALAAGIPELLYVSSAVIYPASAAQPITEDRILTGAVEPENESYALAKIAGVRRCAYASAQHGVSYRAVAPNNMYGPGDDPRPGRSHVVASAIAKTLAAIETGADQVEVWGDGSAQRELSYVADLAGWLVQQPGRLDGWPDLVNLGSGEEVTVRRLYETVARLAGFTGRLSFDASQPIGMSRRVLDSSRARALGWAPTTSLEEGLALCIDAAKAARTARE
jgi:GDP-L-fucose synthase